MKIRVATRLVVLGLLIATPASAESTAERTSAITHELMSPFCPELLLADCPSERAGVLRDEIERRVEAGEAAPAIEDDLAARFGDQIRTIPKFRGFGSVAWIGPPLVGALGLLIVALAVRSATRFPPVRTGDASIIDVSDQLAFNRRLQDELDDMD